MCVILTDSWNNTSQATSTDNRFDGLHYLLLGFGHIDLLNRGMKVRICKFCLLNWNLYTAEGGAPLGVFVSAL